jgi:signal transduction histidine kinase/HAMP domain-containing protein
MTLKAKLTLGTVVLATAVVTLISTVNLVHVMQLEYDATLKRAALVSEIAAQQVVQALDRRSDEPLRDPVLSQALIKLISASDAIIEVAVVDPRTNQILADSDPARVGMPSPSNPDFRPLVNAASWSEKLRLLLRHDPTYYQLERPLGSGVVTLYSVRVIVAPALISDTIVPTLVRNVYLALASILGAAIITFLFATVAFRPLGRIGRMLDLAARGDYESEPETAANDAATDELSVISSKVSLLGQRLRGAHDEVSDLRGNLDRLFQDLEDAVFLFNREQRLVFASGSVEKFLGKERTSLPGQSVGALFPPATPLGLLIAEALSTHAPARNRRVPLASPDGGSPLLLSVDLLDNSGVLVRLRDPEVQRKIGRQLQTADRLAAISRIQGGVAHEVKNPLNAILLHVEVARARLAQGQADVTPQMEIISREILRLDRVVKTFLDFTRPVELNLTTVSLQELLSELVELARPQAKEFKIKIEVSPQPDDAEVRVDRDLLKQAVLNIVVNAMQSMPDGGDLRFEALANGDTAELRISDTGGGIPPELRDKIFRLYFTTKQQGSGIGLAMTFRIIQLHDGTIDFTSEPGKGTTFSIRLPIAV